mgnify:CR=1 FL=1
MVGHRLQYLSAVSPGGTPACGTEQSMGAARLQCLSAVSPGGTLTPEAAVASMPGLQCLSAVSPGGTLSRCRQQQLESALSSVPFGGESGWDSSPAAARMPPRGPVFSAFRR